MRFSEESELLIENWDTFQDVMRAYRRLAEEEMPELVQSITSTIESERWCEGWRACHDNELRIRYFNPDWMVGNDHLIDVGAYSFTPNRLFGSDDDAVGLFVWVRLECRDVANRLLKEIEARDLLLGEADPRGNTTGIVDMRVQKYPPGSSLDTYADAVSEQVIGFFEHYLPALIGLDDVIQEELGRYRS